MPQLISDIVLRLAREHLQKLAAKRQAAAESNLSVVVESLPDGAANLAIDGNADLPPARDAERVTDAPSPPGAPGPAVPANDLPVVAPVASPQSFPPGHALENVPDNPTRDLIPFEQLPFPSPAPFDFPAEPGLWPAVDDRQLNAAVPPDPARRFEQSPVRDEVPAAHADDSAARLEQVTRDMEASLTRLLTTQIEALTRLRERLEDHERRWVEQASARRAIS
jgi:hypothetical protein